jgi:hypothetical protein
MRTSVGASPDPQAYVYLAKVFKDAGRSAATFTASVDNFVRAVEKAAKSIHGVLEQYYFDCEAERRWENEGGSFRDDSGE